MLFLLKIPLLILTQYVNELIINTGKYCKYVQFCLLKIKRQYCCFVMLCDFLAKNVYPALNE